MADLTQLWMGMCFPELALAVHTRADAQPGAALVLESEGGREWVYQCNQAARDAGIDTGMPLAAAMAISDDVQIYRRDVQQERKALQQLANWAGQFSSQVSLDQPDTLLLEVKGSLTYFGGPRRLWKQVSTEAHETGYDIRLAVAPTPTAAALLARQQHACWLSDLSSLKQTLSAMPVQVLDENLLDAERLISMGILDIGACIALPRDGLRRRFGRAFIDYLDRLLGARPDPRAYHQPPRSYQGQLALPAPVELTSALLFAGKRLIRELSGALRACHAGTQCLDWQLIYEKGQQRFQIQLVEPAYDPERLASLLQTHLERIQLAEPVIVIALQVKQFFELEVIAEDFWGTGAKQASHSMLLNRLTARLGDDAITGMCLWPDYRPEKAWRECEPGEYTDLQPVALRRPTWLLPEPKKIIADSRGMPCWKGALKLETGPERIQCGWWDGEPIKRDYFIATNPHGQQIWIYCVARQPKQKPDWYLHGFFA